MIGIIQVISAPYRDNTFLECQENYSWDIDVATFPDGMDTHPEWNYHPLKEDYIGKPPKTINFLGRKMVYNSDIRKWFKDNEFEAVLIEGYNSFTNIYAIMHCFRKRIPLILGLDSVTNPGHKFLKRYLYRRASAFWVPGLRSKKYLISEGIKSEKIFFGKYTYDYKELYEIVNKTNKADQRRVLNILDEDIVFLFIGKLIKSRNIALLLDSFHELNNEHLKLIIIGDGPEEYKIGECFDSRIIHIPRVPLAELYNYYAISDIYVHPGSEPYSLAVVQAVASDLIVVASRDVGAVDDVIKNNENGILFSYGNQEELQNSLNQVLENYDSMKESARNSGKFIREERSIEYSSAQLSEAIKYAMKR